MRLARRLMLKLDANTTCSTVIIIMINQRRMRWAGHVERMRRSAYRVLARKPERRHH
jgi:hypothetical protein